MSELSPTISKTVFQLGQWLFDPQGNFLRQGSREQLLEPRLSNLLAHMARHPGQPLGKGDLLDTLWPGKVVNEDSLAVAVSQLRKALGDNPRRPAYIKTLPGIGYQLVAPCQPLEARPPRIRRWRLPAVLSALVALVLVAGVSIRLATEPGHGPAPEPAAALQQAREALREGDSEAWRQAIDPLREHLGKAPEDAAAYTLLAEIKMRLLGGEITAAVHFDELHSLLARALALDETDWRAQLLMADLLFWQGRDQREVERHYRRSLALAPRRGRPHFQFAQWLLARGRFAEARAHIAELRRLEPLNYSVPSVAWILYMQGRYGEAREELARIASTEPQRRDYHSSAYKLHAALGEEDTAFAHLRWLMRDAGIAEERRQQAEQVFRRGGLAAVDAWLLASREQAELGQYRPPLSWARYALGAGDPETAMEFLEQAYAERQLPLLWLAVDPKYAPLHGHPRFAALLQSSGWQ